MNRHPYIFHSKYINRHYKMLNFKLDHEPLIVCIPPRVLFVPLIIYALRHLCTRPEHIDQIWDKISKSLSTLGKY